MAAERRIGNKNSTRSADTSTAPWASWKGSRVGLYKRFMETYLVPPKGHGAKRPMVVHPFQTELLEQWLDPTARAAMAKIGRGNGKSTFVAATLAAHLFLEEDAESPIAATTVGQAARALYNPLVRMVELSPELSARSISYKGVGTLRLSVPANNSVAYPIADDPAGLQGLDFSMACLDEAADATVETWSSFTAAGGKRPVSLALAFGTPSFKPENAMWAMEKALKSGQPMPGFRWREWTAPEGCDHRDEAMWHEASPALSVGMLGIDALRTDLVATPEQWFRCYRLAQWPTGSLTGWLGEDAQSLWDAGYDPSYAWSHVEPMWLGVDVSLKHDSTAVVAVQQRPDGRFHARARIWFPGSGVVDQAEVREHIRQMCRDFKVVGVAYDPRFFVASAQDLEAEGHPMIEVPQSPQRMVPAIGAAYQAIVSGSLTHDGDPTFAHQVISAVPRPSETGFTLQKQHRGSVNRIDACIALALAMGMATLHEPEPDLDNLDNLFHVF